MICCTMTGNSFVKVVPQLLKGNSCSVWGSRVLHETSLKSQIHLKDFLIALQNLVKKVLR
jgi:hypothetical protein